MIGDKMMSMRYGPVLSNVYDLFSGNDKYWANWIHNPGDYKFALAPQISIEVSDPLDTFDELSVADAKILDSVSPKFGGMNQWKICDFTHDKKNCPEWEDPHGSSYPISLKDLLLKNGKKEDEVNLILQNIEEIEDLHDFSQVCERSSQWCELRYSQVRTAH